MLSLRVVHEGAEGAESYWLNLPSVFPTREFTGAWLAATLASMLLALLGAWWLQRHINRPLVQVVGAAQQLAQGQSPATLPDDGPEEIATVARSFNQMAQSLATADHERALMLAGVSHDLRTPLTKLRLGVEIAGAQVDAPLAASMARSIDEMDGIVGQFLQFARSGEAEAPTTASLNDLAQAVAEAQADHGRALVLELGALPDVPVRPQALPRAGQPGGKRLAPRCAAGGAAHRGRRHPGMAGGAGPGSRHHRRRDPPHAPAFCTWRRHGACGRTGGRARAGDCRARGARPGGCAGVAQRPRPGAARAAGATADGAGW